MNLFSDQIMALKAKTMEQARPLFARIDEISERNTAKVLKAFRNHQISEYLFRTTTGYGYGDSGRDRLEAVWAELCGAEKALVRTQFVSGTHALACVLFGLLRPGDELLALTGTPYDTMQTVIGQTVNTPGSLIESGITYQEIPMTPDGINLNAIAGYLKSNTKIALIQRSRGYSLRKPLSISEISAACAEIKRHKPDCICFVDNCYGEFVDITEPTAAGVDIMAGSLIKNPGGGLAPSGGYIAGKTELVDMASYRLTAPGLGGHLGASLADSRLLYQGLFLAPHVVAQSLKGAIFAAILFDLLGYKTLPHVNELRSDIIQAIELGSPEKMIAFCQGLQQYSPVDAHVRPLPGPMPGYTDQVIMAGGTFIQGSSIELSADGPLRPPYIIYLQGGLTFEHAALGILGAANAIINM
ncbi:methionine gamma-lyase family protein [Sporomusa sp. KB1]|jgi:cystathionine beta-lyase family protein involved in aluminum resistance|uniref:methionine gamma-lyase family protein n=1 Tax=Sporomusa sp. KB1 TaxID=943346 RepID=UPI00119DB34C|nr:methionine gamma-lyase family protein [Sporomusa sp. KB1]TWH49245.1 cystathionine beta-lyase family protein involved in aluminum resistance [Sporomusa sp. KB1]